MRGPFIVSQDKPEPRRGIKQCNVQNSRNSDDLILDA